VSAIKSHCVRQRKAKLEFVHVERWAKIRAERGEMWAKQQGAAGSTSPRPPLLLKLSPFSRRDRLGLVEPPAFAWATRV
jgi:hypothetical protein